MGLRPSIGLAAAMLAALTFATAPAGAKTLAKPLLFSLGPIGRPNAISIDQATGNVYVTDHATQTVKIFGAEGGGPTGGAPTEVGGAETPSGSFNFLEASEPVGVAVNEAGVLYVADVGHKAVDKFKLEGGAYKYVCQFTGFGNAGNGCLPNLLTQETNPTKPFTGPGGIAIDGAGNVYVSDFGGSLYEFNAAGEDVGQTAIPSGEPSGVAVDSNGVVYVQDFQGPVYKLTPGIGGELEVTLLDGEHSYAVAVNPANNHVYIDHHDYVLEREPPEGAAPGEVIGELPPEGGLASEGIAVNAASGDVYIGNVSNESIEAFEFVRVPDVRLSGAATAITATGATVHGEIDPEETSAASYYFEYGPASTFNASSSPTSVPAVNEFIPATAALTGLQAATEYSYRLVGTNSFGLLERSEVGSFTTLGVEPEVSGVEAIDVTTDSVVFRGFVNPRGDPTSFHFEYGATAGYGQSLPDFPIATTATPIEVEEAASGLRPGNSYHFRIVAHNAAGEAVSTDQTFTTLPAPTPPEVLPVLSTGPAIAITQSSAVLTGTVFPESTQTMYLFELGTSTAYGTQLLGGEAGRESGLAQVSVATAFLQPATVYHYRIVAVSAAGTSVGPDRTFSTTAFPQQIFQPSTPGLVPLPVFPAVKNPVFKPPRKHRKHHRGKPKHRRAHGRRAASRRHRGR